MVVRIGYCEIGQHVSFKTLAVILTLDPAVVCKYNSTTSLLVTVDILLLL